MANQTTTFLRINLSSCPKDVKAKCYKSIVRPHVEYASTVLDPVTKSNIVKMESYKGVPPGFAAITFGEPVVSLQCCKSLVGRTFIQGEIRTKQQWCIGSSITWLKSLQTSSHGRINKRASSTIPANILFYEHLQGILPSLEARLWNGLTADVISAATLEDFKHLIGAGILRSWL